MTTASRAQSCTNMRTLLIALIAGLCLVLFMSVTRAAEGEQNPGLTAPGGSFANLHLPDPEQDTQMQALLYRLEYDAEDSAARGELSQLMDEVAQQARIYIEERELGKAVALLDVIEIADPGNINLATARRDYERQSKIDEQLAKARSAMANGRVDMPETSSAWYFYRQVLDQDPDNEQAQLGLIAVQQNMLTRALGFARQLDFDSAEQMLEDASYVREPQALVEDAREEIEDYRLQRAEQLESDAMAAMDAGEFGRAERAMIDLIALGGADSKVSELRRRLKEARVYGGLKPGQVIRESFLNKPVSTPDTVVVLAGSFMMGSNASEKGRRDSEKPQHRVKFQSGFAIGLKEVSVAEFEVFTDMTGYQTTAELVGTSTIYDHRSGRLTQREKINWRMDYEGRPAEKDNPVVHISWKDAQAYVEWLARGTGKNYRLPTEAEFEYVLRGGKATRYWWGDGSPAELVENITGEGDTSRLRRSWSVSFEGYTDKFWGPAPVASFGPSPFGLYDIGGNVGEWVQDCWHDTYIRAPADGSAWINPGCEHRVIRGGYWASSPDQTRAAYRIKAKPGNHDARIGFRIARDL